VLISRCQCYLVCFSSVQLWNQQPENIKSSRSVQIIKSNLQPQNNTKPIYYYIGTRLGQILHARLRMQCSSRLLLIMNFCTFKNISVFRVFVKSVEPNNNKSVFKLIGKLMVWIYLSLVALWRGQCSRKWAVVSVAPHWQNGEFTMFLRNKWWLRELHCIRNLACKICPSRVPI
jgi:hypothetical protein